MGFDIWWPANHVVEFAPVVEQGGGASNINATTATLDGRITSACGATPTVSIYQGPADGGTTRRVKRKLTCLSHRND